jgi:hypothetical protein
VMVQPASGSMVKKCWPRSSELVRISPLAWSSACFVSMAMCRLGSIKFLQAGMDEEAGGMDTEGQARVRTRWRAAWMCAAGCSSSILQDERHRPHPWHPTR